MSIENRLPQILQEKGGKPMTQYQLMKSTGLAQGTARRALENKEWFPSRDTASKICMTFGLQLSDWLYFSLGHEE